jgi:transposase
LQKGRRDPQTRIIELVCIPLDFRNTYTIIGVCSVASETVPFDYILHEGTNDAAIFSDVILMMVADKTLVRGNVLVMDNAAIHHYHESSALDDVLWDEFEIAIIFLPTRAPELNPIELLWNIMVWRMKIIDLSSPDGQQRHVAATAAASIMDSFTHYDVAKCYQKCHYFSY